MTLRVRPVHFAVLLVALSVAALWQPYWHTQEQRDIICIAQGFTSYEAAKDIQNNASFNQKTVVEIKHHPTHEVIISNGWVNGTWASHVIVENETWSVSWYTPYYSVVVYDYFSLGNSLTMKLFVAALFLLAVGFLVVWDMKKEAK